MAAFIPPHSTPGPWTAPVEKTISPRALEFPLRVNSRGQSSSLDPTQMHLRLPRAFEQGTQTIPSRSRLGRL